MFRCRIGFPKDPVFMDSLKYISLDSTGCKGSQFEKRKEKKKWIKDAKIYSVKIKKVMKYYCKTYY